MNKILSKIVFAVFIFEFILVSCGTNKSDNKKETQNTSLKVEIIKIDKNSEGCEDKDLKDCAELKIEYPLFSGNNNNKSIDAINENIRLQLLQPILDEGEYDSLDTLIDAFFNEFNSVVNETAGPVQGWQIERIMKIKNQSDKILAIEYSDYSYLGGAHPNSFVTYSNYNLLDGELVSLDDCFTNGYEKKLNSIAEKIFRKQKQLKPDEDLNSAGYWFDENKFEINDNFAILNDGLLFYFNAYDIAPYAMGPTEMILPYSEVKQLILSDGPLSEFINN
jgi:hypothetical protein